MYAQKYHPSSLKCANKCSKHMLIHTLIAYRNKMHRVRRKLNNKFIPSEFWEHPTQEKILIPSSGCICVLVGLGEI